MSYREARDDGRLSPPLTNFSSSSSGSSSTGGPPFCHKRTRSLGGVSSTGIQRPSTLGSSTLQPSRSTRSLYSGGVLGQNYGGSSPGGSKRGSKNSVWGLNLTMKSKTTRSPQPIQALAMFEAVGRGLRECIRVADDDISGLKANIDSLSLNSSQGKLYELEKQLKAAERYLKRVEFQLAKLEELLDQYELQQKLREGVRSMAYAYVLSPGKERNSALNNVRCGYRECSEVMCTIERELEQMMGTLTLQMKGIQGFSRLVPGDVFEINIKHGPQKWKNKGRILKNSEQAWDHDQNTFKVLLTDVLVIKAVEMKGLGKTSALGTKFCDTADLFSAHPQIMTVNLNASGSLKLNLIVTWNPLHCTGGEDGTHLPMMTSGSTRSSPRSTRTYTNQSPITPGSDFVDFLSQSSLTSVKIDNTVQSPDRDSGNHELSSNCSSDAYSQRISSDLPQDLHRLSLGPPKHDDAQEQKVNGKATNRPISPLSNASVATSTSSLRGSGSQLDVVTLPVASAAVSLQTIVNAVIGSLEDIQGQYPELQNLETAILQLDENLRNISMQNRRRSIVSNISLSVENALGYFDFLDSEDDSETYNNDRMSPGVMSLEKVLDSRSSATNSPTNGHDEVGTQMTVFKQEQVELALITHLTYCKRLIENLGSYGPLKCRELISLIKLKAQTSVVERLHMLVKQTKRDKTISGNNQIKEVDVQALWEQCTADGGRSFCITCDILSWKLQEVAGAMLPMAKRSLRSQVVEQMIKKIMDVSNYQSEDVITVYQFQAYFGSHGPIKNHMVFMADEVAILNSLDTNNWERLQQVVGRLSKQMLPSKDVIKKLALHLASCPGNKEFIAFYLEDLSQNEEWRQEILQTLVFDLESNDEATRQGTCVALQYFQPYDYMEQLGYVAQTDAVETVRQAAATTLLTLGEFGQQALQAVYVGKSDVGNVTML